MVVVFLGVGREKSGYLLRVFFLRIFIVAFVFSSFFLIFCWVAGIVFLGCVGVE